MVKVISEKPIKTKTIVCPNCGYDLEYTGEDVRSHTASDYGGGSDTYYHIVCPRNSCNHKIFVKSYV